MTNDAFIKMVLALPDKFFEGWEWKDGDTFLIKQSDETWRIEHIGDYSLFEKEIGYTDGWECEFHSLYDEEVRPLPSQRQLQSICMNIINCTPMELLKFLDAWIYEDDVKPKVKFESWDELWLMYTCWVWGRLKWDGKTWN